MEVAIAIRCGLCTRSEMWLKFMIFLAQFRGPHANETFLFASIENFGGVKMANKSRFLWFIKFLRKKIKQIPQKFPPPPQPPDRPGRIVRCWERNVAKLFFSPREPTCPQWATEWKFYSPVGKHFSQLSCGKLKTVSFSCQFSGNLELRLQFSCNFSISAC